MSPEFPLPEPPEPDFIDAPGESRAAYLELLRKSDERTRSLERVKQSLAMLHELHNATVAAFREELQRAVRERMTAEMLLLQARESFAKVSMEMDAENARNVRTAHERFKVLFNALSRLVDEVRPTDAERMEEERGGMFTIRLREALEVLATASEYLD